MDGGVTKSMSGIGGGGDLGGGFSEDNLEDDVSQSSLTQNAGHKQTGGSDKVGGAGNISPAQQAQLAKAGQKSGQPGGGLPGDSAKALKPREVGTLGEELIKRPFQDIVTGLKSLFDINALLGIKPAADTPEEQAKKKQIHQRFNQLTQEEQAYAQKKYQQEMQKKQQEEQEKQIKKQREEQAKAQAVITPPSSPQRGEVGPAGKSGKSRAMQQLKSDRTTIGKIQGAN